MNKKNADVDFNQSVSMLLIFSVVFCNITNNDRQNFNIQVNRGLCKHTGQI